MKQFWDVYWIIQDDYFSDSKLDTHKIVEWAIKWMVESLWDKHSEFMNPEMSLKFNESLTWDFEGIWAVVEKVPLWVKIERVIKWSPALLHDVRADDIIIEANGVSLEDLDLYDAVDQIKWPAGTSVLLKILRQWEKALLEITVIRDKIHIPSVEEKYFEEENIAYIALNMYGESTGSEFREALTNVSISNTDGLIIDLRNNGGWYIETAVEILSEFIPSWKSLVKTRYKDSYFDKSYSSVNSWKVYDKKIVILINRNSASAAEITAGTLREYNLALLVGEKTYGKWSVQQPFKMEDGSLLKLTVAKWFTPGWKNIDIAWVSPDIEILLTDEDYKNKYDRQLEEAKKILKIYNEKKTIGLTVESYKSLNENSTSEIN